MGSLTSMIGGGKGGSGIGFGGLSPDDMALIGNALGINTEMLHSTYQQLGLGNPDPSIYGGDPATAAAGGGSLAYGSPGTAETRDVQGLSDMANAALGKLQLSNQNNPAISGTGANITFNNNQLNTMAQQSGFTSGFNSPTNSTGV